MKQRDNDEMKNQLRFFVDEEMNNFLRDSTEN